MKKIFFSILLSILFFIPGNALAEDTTDKLYMDIEIMNNGSIKVRELAVLNGSYNGRAREIAFKNNNAPAFNGSKESLKGSDLYNGSGIRNIKIGDISKNDLTFDSIYKVNNFYNEVSYAENGKYGVYTKVNQINGYDFKIFSPSHYDKAFYMEYIVDDVVIVHNDIAEIGWNILGDSYRENIDELIVKVHLMENDESMRVWLHGPLNGEIERTSDKLATIKYNFLGAHNPIDFRMTFDKNLVPNATKFSNIEAVDNILEIEQELADQANSERNKIKALVWSVRGISVLWFISLIVVIIYMYKKYDKELKVDFDHEYYRDFPDSYGPEILEYLIGKNITTKGLSATILEIIRKKAIIVEDLADSKNKKKDYVLKKNDKSKEELTEQEMKIFDLLINKIGNGEQTTLNEIKKFGKSLDDAKVMTSEYRLWQTMSLRKAKNYKFYQSLATKKILPCLLASGGFIIFFLNLALDVDHFIAVLAILFGIGAILYFCLSSKRTEKGALQYKQWMAFKKFLQDFGTLDEKQLPEIILWERYLVYATVLGCAKQLEKEMKIKIANMETNDTILADRYMQFYYINHLIGHSVATDISNTMINAVESSNATIASSQSSSGGGFGGGASFGGGSFGGGGGGGRF